MLLEDIHYDRVCHKQSTLHAHRLWLTGGTPALIHQVKKMQKHWWLHERIQLSSAPCWCLKITLYRYLYLQTKGEITHDLLMYLCTSLTKLW